MSIRVLHLTAHIGKDSFGVGQVAVNLVKAQNDLGADARIWCTDSSRKVGWAVDSCGLSRERVQAFRQLRPARLGFSHAMLLAARSHGNEFDVIHQHGIWTACSHVSNTVRRVHRVPTVVAPHGSLQEWALSRSPWKKRLALFAYEHKNLHQAACLHATAEAEIADFRNYGLSNPIALIPNGVSNTWLERQGDGTRFREQRAIPPTRRLILFLSRITPKKGLPLLLEAVNLLRNDLSAWLVIIAGTGEFGHLQEVKSLVAELNLQDLVMFTGPLYDQAKRDALAASDVFVLPSYSEGAPMVVLDCLAAGVPIITTKGTPWQSLLAWRCGWWVEASADAMVQALQEMLGLSKGQLRLMGQRGKDLVRSQYLWAAQAEKTLDLYAWLCGRQRKPDFVVTD